jgi:tetratricopeptide (TPR) repeat protein
MSVKRLSVLLCFFVFVNSTKAQHKADSIQNLILQSAGIEKATHQLELARYYLETEPEDAISLVNSIIFWTEQTHQGEIRIEVMFIKAQALFLTDSLTAASAIIDQLDAAATKAKNKKMLAQSLLLKGNIEWKKQEYHKALAIYKQLIDISRKNNYSDLQIEANNQMGLIFREQGQNESSLKQFLKALELESKTPNPALRANTLNYLGSYYWRAGQYPKALEYYQQALVIREKSEKERDVINSLINLGIVYQDMGNYLLALDNQNKALELLKNHRNLTNKALVLNHIGNTYWRMGCYDTSLTFYKKSKIIRESFNDLENIASLDDNIGHVFKMTNRFDSALTYYNNSLQIRQQLNIQSKQAYSLSNIGSVYLKMAKYPKALDYYFKALSIREELKEQDETASSLNNIAMIYCELSEFEQSIAYHQRALEIYEKSANKAQTAVTLNYIGNVYWKSNNLNLALENHMKALRIRQETGDQAAIGTSLNNIGLIYRDMDQFQKSESFFIDAIEIYKKIGNHQSEAFTRNNLGDVYDRWNKPQKALELYQQALSVFIEINDQRGIAIVSENIGQLYLVQNNLAKAKPYLDRSWKIALEIKDGELIKNTGFDNYKLFEKTGNYPMALDFYKNYTISKDSISISSNASKMLEIQSRYELDAKQKEIELLKSNTELIRSKMQYQKRITWFLGIISVLLLVLCGQLYLSFRNKKAANKMFEKIFSIIAHDLRSPVAAMNNLSGLLNQKQIELTETERNNLMEHIESLTQSLMGLLDNLLNWSRNRNGIIEYKPENLPLSQLISETIQLANPVAMNKQITILSNVDESLTIYADKNGCLLILRNLVMNAIKFSRNSGTIKVFTRVEEHMAIIGVQDFGIGIAPDELNKIVQGLNTKSRPGTQKEKGFGMGLKLCNDFIKVNKGKLWAESIENEQTIFYFSLPLAKL